MTVGHGHGGNGRIDIVYPRLHALENGGGGKSGGGVALHVNGNGAGALEPGDQFIPHVRVQQAGHILDGDGVSPGVLDTLAHLHPGVHGVHRAEGVGDGALGVFTHFLDGFERHLQVAHIVHGVEHTKYIDAVDGGPLDKFCHHVIGVMAVAQDILAPEQHLLGRVRHGLFQLADALPGILPEVADTRVESRPTPGFQRPEAHLVQFGGDRQHIVKPHAGGQK